MGTREQKTINKNKNEIARIIGRVDFSDEKFISWLDSIK